MAAEDLGAAIVNSEMAPGMAALFDQPASWNVPGPVYQRSGTNVLMPGSRAGYEEYGIPPIVRQSNPFTSTAWRSYIDPFGQMQVQPLVGFPSQYPHVLSGVPQNPMMSVYEGLGPLLQFAMLPYMMGFRMPGMGAAPRAAAGGGGGTRAAKSAPVSAPASLPAPAAQTPAQPKPVAAPTAEDVLGGWARADWMIEPQDTGIQYPWMYAYDPYTNKGPMPSGQAAAPAPAPAPMQATPAPTPAPPALQPYMPAPLSANRIDAAWQALAPQVQMAAPRPAAPVAAPVPTGIQSPVSNFHEAFKSVLPQINPNLLTY